MTPSLIRGTIVLMPTLQVPNMEKLQLDQQMTPPPIARAGAWVPIPAGTPVGSQSQTQTTSCQPPGLNLSVYQGATLSSTLQLTITDSTGLTKPLDITGNKFEFTAKLDLSLPDTDPSVVKVDWTETDPTRATAGTTTLKVDSNVTAAMALAPYFYQVRMVASPTSPSPIVTQLYSGTLTVLQPVSPRY